MRAWSEKLPNALAQVRNANRKVLDLPNAKLESMDGAVPEHDAYNQLGLLSGRMMTAGYTKASAARQQCEGDNAYPWFPEEYVTRLEEDQWYILTEKLDGAEPRAKIQGPQDCEGLLAYIEICKWYSAVAGVTLPAKMTFGTAS